MKPVREAKARSRAVVPLKKKNIQYYEMNFKNTQTLQTSMHHIYNGWMYLLLTKLVTNKLTYSVVAYPEGTTPLPQKKMDRYGNEPVSSSSHTT
jgi:hypothetical protein